MVHNAVRMVNDRVDEHTPALDTLLLVRALLTPESAFRAFMILPSFHRFSVMIRSALRTILFVFVTVQAVGSVTIEALFVFQTEAELALNAFSLLAYLAFVPAC